jgi:hypothetical protein
MSEEEDRLFEDEIVVDVKSESDSATIPYEDKKEQTKSTDTNPFGSNNFGSKENLEAGSPNKILNENKTIIFSTINHDWINFWDSALQAISVSHAKLSIVVAFPEVVSSMMSK